MHPPPKKRTGHDNTTVKVTLKNLYDTHDMISAYDLDVNLEKMKTPCNQEESLENNFYQVTKGADFVEKIINPMSNTQVLNLSCVIMAQAQVFKEACKA